jgi:hypothetical protein
VGPEQAPAAAEFAAAYLLIAVPFVQRETKPVGLAELALLSAATELRALQTMLAG